MSDFTNTVNSDWFPQTPRRFRWQCSWTTCRKAELLPSTSLNVSSSFVCGDELELWLFLSHFLSHFLSGSCGFVLNLVWSVMQEIISASASDDKNPSPSRGRTVLTHTASHLSAPCVSPKFTFCFSSSTRLLPLQLVIYYISHDAFRQAPGGMSELVQVICWIYKQVNEMWKRESLRSVGCSCGCISCRPCFLSDGFPARRAAGVFNGRWKNGASVWLIKATTVRCGRPYQTKLPVWKFTSKPSREGRPCSVCDRDNLQPGFTVLAGYPQTRGDGGRERRGKVTGVFKWRQKGWRRPVCVILWFQTVLVFVTDCSAPTHAGHHEQRPVEGFSHSSTCEAKASMYGSCWICLQLRA